MKECWNCGDEIPADAEVCETCGAPQNKGEDIGPGGKSSGGGAAAGTKLDIGDVFADRYEIRGISPEGGLGTVYKVHDREIEVALALKVIQPDLFPDEQSRKGLRGAIKKARRFLHKNAIRLYESGEEGGAPYYTMEFIGGINLRKLLQVRADAHQHFTIEEAAPIIEQLASVLDAGHDQGLRHGDIKPENIVILPEGLKLSEFGVVTVLPSDKLLEVQKEQGTEAYLAPEVVSGDEITPRADIYSVGAMLFEMLTGRVPEKGSKVASEFNESLPNAIDDLLERCLNDDPAKRPASVGEIYSALVEQPDEAPSAASSEPPAESPPPTEEPVEESAAEAPGAEEPPVEEPPVAQPEAPEPPAPESPAEEPAPAPPPPAEPEPPAPEPEPEPEPAPPPAPEPTPPSKEEAEPEPTAPQPPAEPPAPPPSQSAPSSAPSSNLPLPELPEKKKGAPIGLIIGAIVLLAGIAGAVMFMGGGEKTPAPVAENQSSEPAKQPAEPDQTKPRGAEPPSAQQARADAQAEEQRAEEQAARQAAEAEREAELAAKRAAEEARRREAEERRRAEEAKKAAAAAAAAASKCPDGMVEVEGITFRMGSALNDSARDTWEKPLEPVSVKGYCIDKYEFPNQKGKKPRGSVTYEQARALCAARDKRLCTEAEWEHACKGSSGARYPYGPQFNASACNTKDSSGNPRALAPSGQFGSCKSDMGVFDMSGNLKEWTSSQWSDVVKDRVVRGGSYSRPDWATRCAFRENFQAAHQDAQIGFRCCADF